MRFTASADRGPAPDGPRRRVSWRSRLAAGAVSAALAGAAVLPVAGPAGASPRGADSTQTVNLTLQGMPHGTVTFHRSRLGLLATVDLYGLTPSSSHDVDLLTPTGPGIIGFSPFTARNSGAAEAHLASTYTGPWIPGSRLVIRTGTERTPVEHAAIAETARLPSSGGAGHRLISVETGVGPRNVTPRGRATLVYDSDKQTLTVTVNASGLSPGPHAAHIHDGTCERQGQVLYMLTDLVANSQGKVIDAVRVFTNVTTPIPASGWYLNIHQGNSANILIKGNPTIYFRPLLCANIRG
jgi:Cu/Zn superoxide dismutase